MDVTDFLPTWLLLQRGKASLPATENTAGWNPRERWLARRAIAVAVPVAVAIVGASHAPEKHDHASTSGRTTNRHLPRTAPAQDGLLQCQGSEACTGSPGARSGGDVHCVLSLLDSFSD